MVLLPIFRSALQTIAKAKPDEVYSLAGQAPSPYSFEQPVETMDSISVGTLNLLEAVRFLGSAIQGLQCKLGRMLRRYRRWSRFRNKHHFVARSPYALSLRQPPRIGRFVDYPRAGLVCAADGVLFNHGSRSGRAALSRKNH